MKHRILELEFIDEDEFVNKTTHPKITYDWVCQSFIVDLGEGAWCEVFGLNRFTKAIQIAEGVKE